jgi:hypothetical protein
MKRIYVKPTLVKSNVALQAVTAFGGGSFTKNA